MIAAYVFPIERPSRGRAAFCAKFYAGWGALYAGYGEGLMGNVRNGIARLRVAIYVGYGGERVVVVGSEYRCCWGKVLRFLLLLPLESSQLEYTLLWKIDLGLRTCMCIRSTRCLMVHAI